METVSGVRGIAGKSLSPSLVVAYAQAFAVLQKEEHCSSSSKDGGSRPLIVVGRDSRVSGPWVMQVRFSRWWHTPQIVHAHTYLLLFNEKNILRTGGDWHSTCLWR